MSENERTLTRIHLNFSADIISRQDVSPEIRGYLVIE
jgi:hypothetical protein